MSPLLLGAAMHRVSLHLPLATRCPLPLAPLDPLDPLALLALPAPHPARIPFRTWELPAAAAAPSRCAPMCTPSTQAKACPRPRPLSALPRRARHLRRRCLACRRLRPRPPRVTWALMARGGTACTRLPPARWSGCATTRSSMSCSPWRTPTYSPLWAAACTLPSGFPASSMAASRAWPARRRPRRRSSLPPPAPRSK